MAKAAERNKTVLESIFEWSLDRPAWQRDALRRIILTGDLENADFGELLDLCKQGRGANTSSLTPHPLEKSHLPANPGQGNSVTLLAIENVTDVNNLAPSQVLSFKPEGITIIYGDNGAGKSGYSRILKRACRARHPGEIYPNIYALQSMKPKPASATISYSIGGKEQKPQLWQDTGKPHPTFSAVSVFDSECAAVHITGKNDVAFRPFGLDVPDELADACQRLKEALTEEQRQLEKQRNAIFSQPPWKATTAVGKGLSGLSHETDPGKVKAFAALSDEQHARLLRLTEDLAKDPAKAAAEQKLRADSVKALLQAVTEIATLTSDESISKLLELHEDAAVKRAAAKLAAQKVFSGEPLPGVGGEVWRMLWGSARRYSMEIAYPGTPFPPVREDLRCVLCQQPLSKDAIARMTTFEEFIRNDTEREAQQAETTFKNALDSLKKRDISTRAHRLNRQEAAIHNPGVGEQTLRYFAAARLRRYAVMKRLTGQNAFVIPAMPSNPVQDILQIEASLRGYANELYKSAAAEERKKLESELAELSDRARLKDVLPTVLQEIERLKAIHFLEQCLGDTTTHSITKLGNDIADTVITPRLRDRFQEEIVKLAADKVRVEIVRSGGKYGSPHYQIRLFAKPEAKVGIVLSEGEKTCVALAAFLTELATATHRSSLVFDDPVSSLDHRWRKQVAARLAEEAAQRQIIVFTHDLVFVNDLHDIAYERKVPVLTLTVRRGQPGAGLVSSGMPWRAQSVEDRIDKLEKAAREARALYEQDQEEEYRRETAHIYNDLRASWERALEDVAFARVIQRHRDYIDTKKLKKVSIFSEGDCDTFDTGFKKCCATIDAHDPSAGRNADAPPPAEVMADIQSLKDWVSALRERQKNIL